MNRVLLHGDGRVVSWRSLWALMLRIRADNEVHSVRDEEASGGNKGGAFCLEYKF